MKFPHLVISSLLCSAFAFHTVSAEVRPRSNGIVHTTDADIAYEQFGRDTSHTPAIIVTGGPGLSHTYMYLTDVFTKKFAHDRSVTFYDQRGMGKSKLQSPSVPQGMEAQVADLEALRARLGYEKIDLIGHSWGGLLVMAYAAEYPQHIQHLVMIDSAATKLDATLFLFDRVYPDQLAEDDLAKKGTDPAAKDPGLLFRRFLARDFYNQERFRQLTRNYSNDELAAMADYKLNGIIHKQLKSYDVAESLKKFSFPTLVMWGRFDMNTAVLTGWQISQSIPGARLVVYPKSGHFPFYEQESLFLHDLNGFLENNNNHRK